MVFKGYQITSATGTNTGQEKGQHLVSTMEKLSLSSWDDKSHFLRFITDTLSIRLKEIWLMTQESSVLGISGASAWHGEQGSRGGLKTEAALWLGVKRNRRSHSCAKQMCTCKEIWQHPLTTQHTYPCWDAASLSMPRACRQDLLQEGSQPWSSVMPKLLDSI